MLPSFHVQAGTVGEPLRPAQLSAQPWVILGRLTFTAPGESGMDCWIEFTSAAFPVFSLLAAQKIDLVALRTLVKQTPRRDGPASR